MPINLKNLLSKIYSRKLLWMLIKNFLLLTICLTSVLTLNSQPNQGNSSNNETEPGTDESGSESSQCDCRFNCGDDGQNPSQHSKRYKLDQFTFGGYNDLILEVWCLYYIILICETKERFVLYNKEAVSWNI